MKLPSELFVRYRWWIGGLLLFWTLVALAGNLRLNSEIIGDDSNPKKRPRREASANLRDVQRDFEDPAGECLLVAEAGPAFDPATVKFMRDVLADVESIPFVKGVLGLDNIVLFRPGPLPRKLVPPNGADADAFAKAKQQAEEHPLIVGQLLSPDLKTQIVRLDVDSDLPWVEKRRSVLELQDRMKTWEERGKERLGFEPRLRLTGQLPIRVDALTSTQTESNRFMVAGVVLAILIAIILFRDFWAVVIVATPPLIAVVWIRGYMGIRGEEPNGLNAVILPILVMMVGFTNAIHLMIDIRRSRSHGLDPIVAAQIAIEHLGPACFWTTLTTAIGLLSLILADAYVIQEFAVTSSIGVFFSFLAVVTLVPLLSTTWIGRHVQRGHARDIVHSNRVFFDAFIHGIIRHAKLVTAISIVLTAALTMSVSKLVPDDQIGDNFPQTSDSFQALGHCDDVIGGIQTIVIRVTWPEKEPLDGNVLEAIGDAQKIMGEDAKVHYPISVRDLLAVLPGSGDLASRIRLLSLVPEQLRQRFVRQDKHQAVILGKCQNLGIATYEPVLETMEQQLAELQQKYPDYKFLLTGSLPVEGRFMLKAIRDLASSLALAAIVIFFVVTIIFRSLRLGLISVVPNAFPLVFTASLLALSGYPLQITSVCAFTVCLGIAVDDTVHFLSRYKREIVVDGDVAAASHRAFIGVGTAMIMSTVIMLVGFLSVLTSTIPSSQLFARLAISTIGSALIGDLIILPAMLVAFAPSGKPRGHDAEASHPQHPSHSSANLVPSEEKGH